MNNKVKSWLFVVVQGILLVLLIFIPDTGAAPSSSVKLLGKVIEYAGFAILLITFINLRKSLTALPVPKENGELQVRGLYKYVRHPMYVGVLTLSLGICISSNSIIKYSILLGLFILFNLKARYEEGLLLAKYPRYALYVKQTPRFLPRVFKR